MPEVLKTEARERKRLRATLRLTAVRAALAKLRSASLNSPLLSARPSRVAGRGRGARGGSGAVCRSPAPDDDEPLPSAECRLSGCDGRVAELRSGDLARLEPQSLLREVAG